MICRQTLYIKSPTSHLTCLLVSRPASPLLVRLKSFWSHLCQSESIVTRSAGFHVFSDVTKTSKSNGKTRKSCFSSIHKDQFVLHDPIGEVIGKTKNKKERCNLYAFSCIYDISGNLNVLLG